MKRDATPKKMEDLCAEPGPEDGIDPKDELRHVARKKGGRKTQQLCGQVAEAIHYALSGACNDDVLRVLGVVAVQPAPDESRLLVSLTPLVPGPCDPAEVMAHLQRAHAKLRAEVAAGIHRKKVPELTFRVVVS
jgi:ribosome-binding factor A